MNIKTEESPTYTFTPPTLANEDTIIQQALAILESRLKQPGQTLSTLETTVKYLQLQFAKLEREVFSILLLDTRHRVLTTKTLFEGTINEAPVYPREVVKTVLEHNAAAVIFAHNHPSGEPEPSKADIVITKRLKTALDVFDISALDHIIISGTKHYSFAEQGLL